MRVTTDATALYERIDAAHIAAAQDTLDDIRRHEVRRTGHLAGSFFLSERPQGAGGRRLRRTYIASSAVYADAVERGANVRERASVRKGTLGKGIYVVRAGKRKLIGRAKATRARSTRRGPHMKGNHIVLRYGEGFLEHMGYRLRYGV